jgi:hypothetical protein
MRKGVGMAILVGLLVSLLSLQTAALAVAAPTNGDLTTATVVAGLPFSDTVGTSQATAAPGDIDCSGLEDTHTVWYGITVATDTLLGLRTQAQFPTEVSASIASGAPGSLTSARSAPPPTAARVWLDRGAGGGVHLGKDPGRG